MPVTSVEHSYRGKHIRATAVLPANSDQWTALIVVSSEGSKIAFGHPVGSFFLTAAEAEWEGVVYAMRWIDREHPK